MFPDVRHIFRVALVQLNEKNNNKKNISFPSRVRDAVCSLPVIRTRHTKGRAMTSMRPNFKTPRALRKTGRGSSHQAHTMYSFLQPFFLDPRSGIKN